MSDNEELATLQKHKANLLNKLCNLRNELQEMETTGPQRSTISSLNTANIKKNTPVLREQYYLTTAYEKKLCRASFLVSGFVFNNVDKNWQHDDVYVYTATVTANAMSFNLDLTVELKDIKQPNILDITCHFVTDNESYLLEITPWVHLITKMRNFSLFMNVVSDYNKQSVIRSKILYYLKSRNYFTIEECTQDRGGVFIYVHKKKQNMQPLLNFHWSLFYLDRNCKIEHLFTINPTKKGVIFAKEHQTLLNDFCNAGLKEKDLDALWSRLLLAISTHVD